ncbi:hypothetical protein ACQY0O_004591 [Thecaphora frezii]
MPTYADTLAHLVASGGVPSPTNVVGAATMHALDGDLVMHEDDHALHPPQPQTPSADLDQIDMIDLALAPEPAHDGNDAWSAVLARQRQQRVARSFWVLDTNILVSWLPLLEPLCAFIQAQNLLCLSQALPPCPIALVLPYVVLTELDGQKTSLRSTDYLRAPRTRATAPLSTLSRNASRWILATLRSQKHPRCVPLTHRALYGQPHSHYRRSRSRAKGHSNDEDLVRFCRELQAEVGGGVVFVTDDRDAAIAAELEDVESLRIQDVVRALDGGEATASATWADHVASVVEQWSYQMQAGGAPEQPGNADGDGRGQALATIPAPSPDHALAHRSSTPPQAQIPPTELVAQPMVDEEMTEMPTPPSLRATRAETEAQPGTGASGCKLGDSIHAPHSYRQPALQRDATTSLEPARYSETNEAETLNPHIEWEALVGRQKHRSRSRW